MMGWIPAFAGMTDGGMDLRLCGSNVADLRRDEIFGSMKSNTEPAGDLAPQGGTL